MLWIFLWRRWYFRLRHEWLRRVRLRHFRHLLSCGWRTDLWFLRERFDRYVTVLTKGKDASKVRVVIE